jgi:polygalacturonase
MSHDSQVRAIADKFKDEVVFEDGVAAIPADFYEKNLAEDVTADQVKAVREQDKLMLAGVTLGMGEASIDKMKENAELKQTSVTMKAIGSEIGVTIDRHKEYKNVQTGDAIHKYGVATTKFKVPAGRGADAHLKQVKASLSDLASECLK